MKKLIPILLVILFAHSASAGLIFDNGSGNKNDTLVIQFCLLDSAGARYTTWDTAYVVQAYGGVDFNIDTLLSPANYRLNSIYPRNLMFEYRLLAGDGTPSHLGAYTWWVLLVDSNNGTDTHQMHKGCYYVSDEPIEDLLAVADTGSNGPLYRLRKIYDFTDGNGIDGIDKDIGNPSDSSHASRRVAWVTDDSLGNGVIPDSVIARIDSIRWAVGMPVNLAGEKYSDNLHKKLGPYLGGNDNVKNAINALSLTGGGSEACTLIVRQNGSAPIQSARIVIRSLDQSATRVPGLFTNIDGKGIAELDVASYFLSVTANNYFPLRDTLIVNRDSTWQISMMPFDPGNPPAPDLCRVYGWVYDIGGENLADVNVSAEIPSDYQPVKYGEIIITPFKKSTTSDSSGYWQIDLFPNSELSKPDSKYLFIIEYPSGVVMKSKAAVPDTASWQFR